MSILINITKAVIFASIPLAFIPVLIWWERKGAAYIQDRRGPNRANILGIRLGGLIQNIADVVKLFFKEDIIPRSSNKALYIIAPMIVFVTAIMSVAVIPFAAPIAIFGTTFKFQIADINVGIIYILAVASLGVYGVMLSGWSSSNSYSLLGGIRAISQFVSYEVAMGLCLIAVLMHSGTVRLDEMIAMQGSNPINWFFLRQPIAFVIFLVCAFAETNRNPFDIPEGESEIVGYHVEYSSMKFAMFFMAEYLHIVVSSMVIVAVFFGGWQIPFLSNETFHIHSTPIVGVVVPCIGILLIWTGIKLISFPKDFLWKDLRDYEPFIFGMITLLLGIIFICASLLIKTWPLWFNTVFIIMAQLTAFFTKVLFFCWFFIWIRWTLPRFRYDQLLLLGWKILVPVSIINMVIVGIIILQR